MISDRADIHPKARLAEDVEVGPWTIIGPDVEIGAGTWIGPHVVINGPTKIGKNCKIYQFSSMGEAPQDKRYKGEPTTLEIGDNNVFRESCTVHRGTYHGNRATIIGDDNLFMAYTHIAHDCTIGNHTAFANNASLAGHVRVDDYAILGAFTGVFQFAKIGSYSFSCAGSMINKDVLPFVRVFGYNAKPYGLNTVGLKRANFSDVDQALLRKAYKAIYRQSLTTKEALVELEKLALDCDYISLMIDFIKDSKLGIVR